MPDEHTNPRKVTMREGDTIVGLNRQHSKAIRPGFAPAQMSLRIILCMLAAALVLSLMSCSGASDNSNSPAPATSDASQTSGPAFVRPELALSPFDAAAASTQNGASIDASHVTEGYVAASATSSARLKFQVSSGGLEYNYDLPNDGTPISCPLSMGNGTYSFTVWENTSGNRYVELASLTDQQVTLADEFQPFIRPSTYCEYNADSVSTKLANELCADAQNEGDVVRAVYDWIVGNIAYNEDKASTLADATGYIPFPDSTVDDGDGICFDYASLAAAMLRSQGIPCKIITGTVSPDNIYHAWNMVYIDGTWVGASIDIQQNTWSRMDTTFAAGNGSGYVGDGISYTEQYTY